MKKLGIIFLLILSLFQIGCFASKNKEEDIYSAKLNKIIEDMKIYSLSEKRATSNNFLNDGIYIEIIESDKYSNGPELYLYKMDRIIDLNGSELKELIKIISIVAADNRVHTVFGDKSKNLFEYISINDTKLTGKPVELDINEKIIVVEKNGMVVEVVKDISPNSKAYITSKSYTDDNCIIITYSGTLKGDEVIKFIKNDGTKILSKSIEIIGNGKAIVNVDISINDFINNIYKIISDDIYVGNNDSLVLKLSKPVASLDAGTYTEAIKVELTSDVEGVTIKYTINGNDPITKGINYVKAIDIDKDTVLKAVAIKDGMETSEILELEYIIEIWEIPVKLSKPVTSLDAGTYTEAIKVELTSDVEGVTIKYTIDGSDPIKKGINYVKAIDIEKDTVVKAVAIKDGMETSEILELEYIIEIGEIPVKLSKPVTSLDAGTYTEAIKVELTSDVEGVTIKYTIDGSDPITKGINYVKAIDIEKDTVVKAVAIKDGMKTSEILELEYIIEIGEISVKLSKPVASLDAGTYTEAIKVELTSDVEGVTIKYTIDGSDPITKGINYVKAIDIEKDTVIKAVAIKDGMETSEILELSYVIVIEKIVTLGNMHPETGPFSKVDYANWKTAKYPLGANFVGDDVTFAVYSKNGTKVLLEIYSSAYGEDATYDYWLEKGADNIWRGKIKNLPVNTYYAFRVWGPNWEYDENWKRGNSSVGFIKDVDANGNRFNPNKVIFDPYAKELSHDKEFPEMIDAGESGGMYGTGGADTKIGVSESPHVYSGPQTTKGVEIDRRNVDTGRWITKGIVIKPAKVIFSKPSFKEENSIIYEAHVRGISAHSSSSDLKSILDGFDGFSNVVSVPEQYRGTYKGAGYLAKYLKAIGVNVIELLPVHETENDMIPFDGTKATAGSANNFWGYMTSGFFAPERRYAYDKSPGGPTREFQEMVKTFNDEGIKVYLDVVYNHTGEGGNWGNMDVTGFISMGGFDVAEYYHLVPGGSDKNWLVDGATGCGNQLNFSSGKSVTHNLVLDSLTYWMDTMGVNGFRFDLAVVLGRDVDKHSWEPSTTYWDGRVKEFYSTHPLLVAIADLGDTYGANMIAEAWDIWGYQVGGFPARWGEWNGRYRDTIRNYMRGQHTSNGVTYADAFNGDYDNFNKHGGPQKSINFIVAHDGFTLTDLVSYNNKMNELTSWPFGPSDGGSDDNQSWDSNGDKELRRQRLRNFWTYQMFSRGTPMIVYGDEITRTQNGNNNPYNLDSVITWNNYNMINTDEPHGISTGYGGTYHNNLGIDNNLDDKNNLFLFATNVMKLRRDTTSLNEGIYSPISFDKADGSIGFNAYFDKAVRIRRGDFLIMSNMAEVEVGFVVPEASIGKKWVRIIDTHNWAEAVNNNFWNSSEAVLIEENYGVNPYSIVVLEEVPLLQP